MILFHFLFFLISSRLNRNIYTLKTNSITNTYFSSKFYNNSNELNKNSNELTKNKGNLNKNNTDGFDMRKTYNDTDFNFHELLIKKQLLDYLLNGDLSIISKLELLNDNEIKPPNLLAGSLFKDWDFN
jgi:hypothetical protein